MPNTPSVRGRTLPPAAAALTTVARALSLAALMTVTTEGCYRYEPVHSATTPLTGVEVTFVSPRALTLDTLHGSTTISGVQQVRGTVAGRNGDSLLVAVNQVYGADGSRYLPAGTVVLLFLSDPAARVARRRATTGTVIAGTIALTVGIFPWIACVFGLKVWITPW